MENAGTTICRCMHVHTHTGAHAQYIPGSQMYTESILFTDDQVLLAEKKQDLQYNVMKLNQTLKL